MPFLIAIAFTFEGGAAQDPDGKSGTAQMMARLCPTGMIFVPSVKGLSHNVAEFTHPGDIEAGAAILLDLMLELAEA